MCSFAVLDQVCHLLLQLQHEDPVLDVLVESIDDELSQIYAGTVRVLSLAIRSVRVASAAVCH